MPTARPGVLDLSPQGLSCRTMSDHYGPTDWDESIATIRRALQLGVSLIDTADAYGHGHNEVLVGRAIAGRRDEVVLATKFQVDHPGERAAAGSRDVASHVQSSCEASLVRLGVDTIDLYYVRAPTADVEIEETVGAMASLVQQGKVRHLGLADVGVDAVRRAAAVHPIAVAQCEYSLWSREMEVGLAPALRELGIRLVPSSPFGRGLTRFHANGDRALPDRLRSIATARGVTAAQIALAWIYAQGARLGTAVTPIPGTKRVRWLEAHAAAVDIVLTADELSALETLPAAGTGGSGPDRPSAEPSHLRRRPQGRSGVRTDHPTHAPVAGRRIGMAVGILMERHQVTVDAAFDVLARASRTSSRTIADVAAELVDTGHLRR